MDVWPEIDSRAVELLEFIRFTAGMPYTEAELKEKPIWQFFDILSRARQKVEALQEVAKKHQKK